MTYNPACPSECATHGQICELDTDHPGDHECANCPSYKARQRNQQVAARRR